MTICFANGKGGSGKTTLALCVAMTLAQAGKRVGVSDRDPQGTATLWLRQIATDDGPFIYDRKESYDVVVIDTPPRLDHPEVRAAIEIADKVLIVTSPSPTDLWTTRSTADLVTQIRPGADVALVFNQVQPGTILGRQLESLAAKIGLRACNFVLRRRQCYQHASLAGWSALTPEARNEIVSLVQEIASYGPNPFLSEQVPPTPAQA